MSKKLIAVASAAALALTALVGVAPAMAAPAGALTDYTVGQTGTGTSTAPYLISVPSANTLVAATNAVTYTISGLATGDVVRVDTTGGIKIMTDISLFTAASTGVNVSTLGTTTYSTTKENDTSIVLKLFTTSTTAGTIVMSTTRTGLSATSTTYLQGTITTAGEHTISAVAGVPATMAKLATAALTFTVKDVFGNAVENDASIIALAAQTNLSVITWDATAKLYKTTLTAPSAGAFVATIDLGAAEVAGLADTSDAAVLVVNSTGVSTQVTALLAQVAAQAAILAVSRLDENSVTQKKYNTLARKWNAAFPSQAVALKK
jgi:hypothetical protein